MCSSIKETVIEKFTDIQVIYCSIIVEYAILLTYAMNLCFSIDVWCQCIISGGKKITVKWCIPQHKFMTSFNKLSKFLFTATIQLKPKNIKVKENKSYPHIIWCLVLYVYKIVGNHTSTKLFR